VADDEFRDDGQTKQDGKEQRIAEILMDAVRVALGIGGLEREPPGRCDPARVVRRAGKICFVDQI